MFFLFDSRRTKPIEMFSGCQDLVKEVNPACSSDVILTRVNGNVIMSVCGDDNPDSAASRAGVDRVGNSSDSDKGNEAKRQPEQAWGERQEGMLGFALASRPMPTQRMPYSWGLKRSVGTTAITSSSTMRSG